MISKQIFPTSRFKEFHTILENIIDFSNSTIEPSPIHIYGVPGSGKSYTAKKLIEFVDSYKSNPKKPQILIKTLIKESKDLNNINELKSLQELVNKFNPKNLVFQFFNCAKKNEIKSLKSFIEITNQTKHSKSQIIFVDEFDCVNNKLKYPILDLCYSKNVLVFVISNNIDVNLKTIKDNSRLGYNKIRFAPYNHNQLEVLIKESLLSFNSNKQNKKLKPEHIKIIVRNMAMYGDMRRTNHLIKSIKSEDINNMSLKQLAEFLKSFNGSIIKKFSDGENKNPFENILSKFEFFVYKKILEDKSLISNIYNVVLINRTEVARKYEEIKGQMKLKGEELEYFEFLNVLRNLEEFNIVSVKNNKIH